MVCRCYGFIGYMRLAVKEHTGTNKDIKNAVKTFKRKRIDQTNLFRMINSHQ